MSLSSARPVLALNHWPGATLARQDALVTDSGPVDAEARDRSLRERTQAFWDGVLSNLMANLLWTLILLVVAAAAGGVDRGPALVSACGLGVTTAFVWFGIHLRWIPRGTYARADLLFYWSMVIFTPLLVLMFLMTEGALPALIDGIFGHWQGR
jgi:ABC-type amino acid transport system permease subunit